MLASFFPLIFPLDVSNVVSRQCSFVFSSCCVFLAASFIGTFASEETAPDNDEVSRIAIGLVLESVTVSEVGVPFNVLYLSLAPLFTFFNVWGSLLWHFSRTDWRTSSGFKESRLLCTQPSITWVSGISSLADDWFSPWLELVLVVS